MSQIETSLKEQLAKMLDGSQAHATFEDAVAHFPVALRSVVPPGLPYSAWQIVEHIRITQHDILTFSDNADATYKPIEWPEDYWLKDPAPPVSLPGETDAWDTAIADILRDRRTFEELIQASDEITLLKPFAWGEGQTLFREALLVLDHAGYHTGELIVLRRLLGCWHTS